MKSELEWNSSWPGLSRPSTSLFCDRFEEIVPIWIRGDNRSNLPSARPMLDIVLALNGCADIIKFFEIDQPLQSIPLGETIHKPGTMLKDAADKVACHPHIEDAIWTIGQKINVPTCHMDSLQDVDGRDKPGHDD